jgi:DNA-binding Lrp family transcriptional regulator
MGVRVKWCRSAAIRSKPTTRRLSGRGGGNRLPVCRVEWSQRGSGRWYMIAAYILIQTEAGRAAAVAAALRDVPGVSEVSAVTGPYDVIVRAVAPNIDELGRLVVTGFTPRQHRTHDDLSGCPPVGDRSPWIITPQFRSLARVACRRCAPVAGEVRCSAQTSRPGSWTHCSKPRMPPICTSGTHPCVRKADRTPSTGSRRPRRGMRLSRNPMVADLSPAEPSGSGQVTARLPQNRTCTFPCIRLKQAPKARGRAEAPGCCLGRCDADGSERARDGVRSRPTCHPCSGRWRF